MKKKNLLLPLLLAALITAASCIAASAAPLSPALDNIAANSKMVKTGFMYNSISFTAEDFKLACGGDFKSITITRLPSAENGKLLLGDSAVRENQSISEKNISKLKYVPANGVGEGSFLFTTGNSYYIECSLRLISDNNSAPIAGGGENVTVWTQENITVFGNLSGSDPEGDKVIFEISEYPEKGLLVLLDQSTGKFKYTPYEGSRGSDCFSYRVRDEYGNYSGEAAVTIAVSRPASDIVFSDMDEHWAHSVAIAAVNRGYMNAESIGGALIFNPELPVSREDFLVTVMNCLGADNLPKNVSDVFADNDKISAEARPYVFAAYHLGIIKGTEDGSKLIFNPDAPITKAEAAVILNNIIRAKAPDTAPVWADAGEVPAWAKNSLIALTEIGIFKQSGDGFISAGDVITRADCADILFTLDLLFDV